MPKAPLIEEDAILESQIAETLMAGLKEYRPDLDYPESHSDMQACVRGLMRMFEIKRRPLPAPLRIQCHSCDGIGNFIQPTGPGSRKVDICETCKGKGYLQD